LFITVTSNIPVSLPSGSSTAKCCRVARELTKRNAEETVRNDLLLIWGGVSFTLRFRKVVLTVTLNIPVSVPSGSSAANCRRVVRELTKRNAEETVQKDLLLIWWVMSVTLRFRKIVFKSDFEYSGLLAQRVECCQVLFELTKSC